MSDYDVYDSVDLKQAFDAAHAGMETMFKDHQGVFTQANLDSAREFIASAPLFANFNSESPIHAFEIKAALKTYFDTRPDQDMDGLTATLVNRWVIGFEARIKKFDDPNEGIHPTYGFPMSSNTLSRPAVN